MARRISLREFQQSLSERLISARKGEGAAALLGVESGTDELPGGSRWLVDLTDSGEVVPLGALTPAPLTRPWFAGVANIRGALYAVVDFSAWRGGPPTPRNAEARLLLIGARHGINAALLVRRALGLRPREGFQALPPKVSPGETPAWMGEAYAAADGGAWTLLRIPPLLADPAYLDIAL